MEAIFCTLTWESPKRDQLQDVLNSMTRITQDLLRKVCGFVMRPKLERHVYLHWLLWPTCLAMPAEG